MEFGEWRQEVFIGGGLFEVERSGLRAMRQLRASRASVETRRKASAIFCLADLR